MMMTRIFHFQTIRSDLIKGFMLLKSKMWILILKIIIIIINHILKEKKTAIATLTISQTSYLCDACFISTSILV